MEIGLFRFVLGSFLHRFVDSKSLRGFVLHLGHTLGGYRRTGSGELPLPPSRLPDTLTHFSVIFWERPCTRMWTIE
jgi:hypothetical protein